MKTKTGFLVTLILTLTLLLLSSCIVKSLYPFYTKDTISFEEKFIGNWVDNEKGIWKVNSVMEKILEDEKKTSISELDKEEVEMYEILKGGYFIEYTKKDNESTFFAMPFKMNDQLFIDFIPLETKRDGLSNLVKFHLIKTHSLVKFDLLDDNSISIKWFDEDKIKSLFKDNKIKIKHEIIGMLESFDFDEETFLLTASSEELQKFISKYMSSDDDDKWKTSVSFILKRQDEKP